MTKGLDLSQNLKNVYNKFQQINYSVLKLH